MVTFEELKRQGITPLLYVEDEMRYGLISNYRRSWSKVGVRTIVPNQQEHTNWYCYSAVSPLSGDSFHLMDFDRVLSATTLLFLTELKKEHPDRHIVII